MNIARKETPGGGRAVFCNRTLNLHGIKAIGFDMDYTLIHYRVQQWEERAYEHLRRRLVERSWPVDGLRFDAELVQLGLILDLELGNIVKADRFGYVKQACHGTHPLPFEELRRVYGRAHVDLREGRWVFLNTLFSLSEACMYGQLVDLLDAGTLHGAMGYQDLYNVVRKSLDEAHVEGELKAEIIRDADHFVELDSELPLALLDLKHAGKKLLLITNSEWSYTQSMMAYAFDRYLPAGQSWRQLFDIVIVSARKPAFFTGSNPAFEVINNEGHLKPLTGGLQVPGLYLGGSAGLVERSLGLSGEEILYVGDHLFADVNVSKSLLRWRTALVLRQLESEVTALAAFEEQQAELTQLMVQKAEIEEQLAQSRLMLQRRDKGYGPQPAESSEVLRARIRKARERMQALDEVIAPLAQQAGELQSRRWGLLLRTGNDKSHLARQLERYADIYTSRVSNLLFKTPFVYLRAPRGSLPHDPGHHR